ncbi:hypothetical protein BS47DRAFT_1401003 [Hydnum rufescens UP504]|uniref:Uncharacterized protein n=1 Tax=Hydnum rufescens UP504 TaxID=1448309 RepID=A0A9P6AFT2_9AGAM|nr:hypothetical protein BS47DRAFT_1401003 [Hydnum rufescens UP504]
MAWIPIVPITSGSSNISSWPDINDEINFFVQSWNNHPLQIQGQRTRSPIDLFGFDMAACGIRGNMLDEEDLQRVHMDSLAQEDLETYGVDWEALRDPIVSGAHLQNNPLVEGTTSWIGRVGPPDNLNEVRVDSPETGLQQTDVEQLYQFILPLLGFSDIDSMSSQWAQSLAYVLTINPTFS